MNQMIAFLKAHKSASLQVLLGVTGLVLAVYFAKRELPELSAITVQLHAAQPLWIVTGIFISFVYTLLQGKMYVYSFRATGGDISLFRASVLFLKRNLLSIFLPAGGFTSLGFFTREVDDAQMQKTQIHLGSTIYAICGFATVGVAAIPTLAYLFLQYGINADTAMAFLWLTGIILGLVWVVQSLRNHGWISRMLLRLMPSAEQTLTELRSMPVIRKEVIKAFIISLLIEVVGIVHLYIAMRAMGLEGNWEWALVGYICSVLLLIVSPFLRGLGAIEMTMTYVLVQYGSPLPIAVAVTLIYRFFEFFLPLLAGIFAFLRGAGNLLLRAIPPMFILALGLVNIISVVTPVMESRIRILKDFVSLPTIHLSNYFVLAAGLLLLITSLYLIRGLMVAWWIAVVLSVVSILGHLGKGIDYEEALLGFFTLTVLLYTRRAYFIKSDPRKGLSGLLIFAGTLAFAFVYGVVGFYFLDTRHFGIHFSLGQSAVFVLRLFFLLDNPELQPKTQFAAHFLSSIYIAGLASLLFGLYHFLKPYIAIFQNNDEQRSLARKLVVQYGRSPMDYFKTYFDKNFYFTEQKDAFISFKTARNFAIVLEEPVCKDEQSMVQVLEGFEKFCKQHGLRPVYYRVNEKSLDLFGLVKKRNIVIGQEAVLDLTQFSMEGKNAKSLRNSVSKAQREGFEFKVYEAPLKDGLLQKLKAVSDEWLGEGRREIAFSSGIFDKEELKQQTILTIEDQEEQVLAFVNLIPDFVPGEATYDLIRRTQDAPGVTIDFLMISMFEYLKSKGYSSVNMGMAPLSGLQKATNFPERTLKFAYEKVNLFSHYKGLRSFKEKFGSHWENKYLVYDNDYELLPIMAALLDVERI